MADRHTLEELNNCSREELITIVLMMQGQLDTLNENIERLIEQVRIPPQIGKYKVYIIDEVHMLSQAAFNAFLKTLEEPPQHAIFILATTEKHKNSSHHPEPVARFTTSAASRSTIRWNTWRT